MVEAARLERAEAALERAEVLLAIRRGGAAEVLRRAVLVAAVVAFALGMVAGVASAALSGLTL